METKILASIGYAFFAIAEVVLLIYNCRPKPKEPRSPEEFMRDTTTSFALHQVCATWILWQAFLDIMLLWNR
jgi:hypothetical protein